MVGDKLDNALATEARILAGGDLGCLLNIAGRAVDRAKLSRCAISQNCWRAIWMARYRRRGIGL